MKRYWNLTVRMPSSQGSKVRQQVHLLWPFTCCATALQQVYVFRVFSYPASSLSFSKHIPYNPKPMKAIFVAVVTATASVQNMQHKTISLTQKPFIATVKTRR